MQGPSGRKDGREGGEVGGRGPWGHSSSPDPVVVFHWSRTDRVVLLQTSLPGQSFVVAEGLLLCLDGPSSVSVVVAREVGVVGVRDKGCVTDDRPSGVLECGEGPGVGKYPIGL